MKVIYAALSLLLAGCASAPGSEVRDDIRALTAFTIEDLRSARDLARASDDPIAEMCWSDLLRAAERLQSVASAGTVGVATRWQIARNIRRNDHEACDALVSDAKSTLLGIAGRLGVIVAR